MSVILLNKGFCKKPIELTFFSFKVDACYYADRAYRFYRYVTDFSTQLLKK